MARSTFIARSVVVALALAVPAGAAAQHAVPRNDPAPSPSSPSSGSSGSSSSSSSNEGSSPAPAPAPRSSDHASSAPDLPSGNRVRMSESASRSNPNLTMRVAPEPGGVVSARTQDGVTASQSVERPARPIYDPVDPSGGRDRSGRPAQGSAVPRGVVGGGDITFVSFPFYGPWGTWYPWYGSGFGYSLGFVSYNPWYYGATGWGWGRYGLWYDPFYYPYDSYSYGGGGGGSSHNYDRETPHHGSLRLKASPSSARVYVDGALAGTVNDFNGFSNHLEIEGGPHELKFLADGYEPKTVNVTVEVDKTITQRVTLKKVK